MGLPALAVAIVHPAEVGVGHQSREEGQEVALARHEVRHPAAARAPLVRDVAADGSAVDGQERVGVGGMEGVIRGTTCLWATEGMISCEVGVAMTDYTALQAGTV